MSAPGRHRRRPSPWPARRVTVVDGAAELAWVLAAAVVCVLVLVGFAAVMAP